ncbi:alpha-L-fucosidase [Cellulophaga baltica]|uniref:alpha-L-fucosidase n=1 Tax=Cellulophaga TaxID=104264 RepID=UPI001C07223A|nr:MULTISPECIES: alpha-L-fucosidase [Cellulophaga]MBU2997994.1 alpha-L-fucosidase [Cellulophaga baltica]MDO6769395.1 alpha-L-fucosidase [Cellulophaga sp. 1_MG-2023]
MNIPLNDMKLIPKFSFLTLCAFFMVTLSIPLNAQDKELSWNELADQYECPEWFRDAKFGIWFHWGPQAQPEQGGGWYARHMYMQDVGRQKFGKMAYPYHLQTYGHPSEFGFKDVINEWKAEKFDAQALINFSKENGAKYIVALANHHDHFDLFNSTYHEWNSVNVGPKKDIIGEFETATRNAGLKFGVTSHDDRFLNWWKPAFGSDKEGIYKGIPYDARLTKADGKGLWWEGLDPEKLYGPAPEDRTPEIIEDIKKNWLKRHIELVTNYKPDLLYNDGFNFTYGDYGKEVTRTLYNNSLKENGKIDAVMLLKRKAAGTVNEVESGGSNTLREYPWQSEITFTDWFYKKDRHLTHNARTILEMLIEAVSKNGNLLLSMELNPDGTIPHEIKKSVKIVGDWLKINGEAIYGTRPWKVYGDGKSVRGEEVETVEGELRNATANQKHGEHFNQRTTATPAFSPDEVRYTTNGDDFYIIVMNPKGGEFLVPSLGKLSEVNPGKLKKLTQLYDGRKILFKQTDKGLSIDMPAVNGDSYPVVLKANFK